MNRRRPLPAARQRHDQRADRLAELTDREDEAREEDRREQHEQRQLDGLRLRLDPQHRPFGPYGPGQARGQRRIDAAEPRAQSSRV